ncbi:uncharacterized protein stbd1 isoform X2 [Gasterosteus aculeatus]
MPTPRDQSRPIRSSQPCSSAATRGHSTRVERRKRRREEQPAPPSLESSTRTKRSSEGGKGGAARDFPPRQTCIMPLKNGNTVAVERRVDLASLFCMIGHHGPAVALAVVAVVSVVAGLVIYRTVRGKRRKAAVADADGGAEGDASVIRESTDVNEGLSDVKADVDLIQNDLRIRHRRAAAEKTSAQRTRGILSSEDTIKDVLEDFCESCLMEPKQIHSEKPKQGEAVSTTESQDDEGGTLEKDVIDETTRQVENFQPIGDSDTEDGEDEDHLDKRSTVKLYAASVQFNEQDLEIEQKGGTDFARDQEVGVLYNGANQAEDKMPSGGSNVACKEEQHCLSVAVTSAPNSLRSLVTAGNHNGGLSGSSIVAECADMSFDCQQPQKDNETPSLDEDPNSANLDPQSERVQDIDPGTAANVPFVIVEDMSCPHQQFICEDKPIDLVEKELLLDSAAAGNKTSCAALVMSVSGPDPQPFTQHPQGDQTKNNSEDLTSAPNMHPPFCQVDMLSFEQFELRDIDMSYGAVGKESGISSLAVSPDSFNEYDTIIENMIVSAGPTEAQHGLHADAVVEEHTAAMVLGPDPSHCCQPAISERKASTLNESFLSQEDMFGREIEESYCSAMDQFAAQIAGSVTCFTDKPQGLKAAVESEEKMTGVNVEMIGATKTEEDEDYEKTEISIMEATMDHNEWIMDNDYKAFPWMTLPVPSSAHDDTKTYQLPSEGLKFTSAVEVTTCTDASDIPPSAKVLLAGTLPLVAENPENMIKIAVVQDVDVTFSIHYITQSPNQAVAVTGDRWELGNWKEFVPLEGLEDGHWATVVRLPSESHVEWKFVVVEKGRVCRWEECGNRLLDTGSRDQLLVHECWARL